MKQIKIIAAEKGQTVEYPVDKFFVASEKPLYIGIITKPEPGIWGYLSRVKKVAVDIDGKAEDFRIPYRIEVGESTIFFLTHSEEK